MTRKEFNTHREVILWFMAEEGRSVIWIGISTIGWTKTKTPLWGENTTYLQNDEYIEFRIALAMGKTVQHNEANWDTDNPQWVNLSKNYTFKYAVTAYRINPDKPNEPKFKVGDYLVDNLTKVPFRATKEWLDSVTDNYIFDNCRLWTIKEAHYNEWVHCWDNDDYGYKTMTVQHGAPMEYYQNIVPVIGQSPKELGF